MATAAMEAAQGAEALGAADFQALEERVLRAVELLRAEREAHAAANGRIAELERHAAELESRRADLERRSEELERQLSGRSDEASRLEGDLQQLQQERDHVRGRVERLLKHLDEFTA